jgi:hypothetical protein
MISPTTLRLLPALLALSAVAACGSTDPSGLGAAELLVRTDKAIYSKADDGPVSTTLVNQGSVPVYLLMGDYVYIEQASDNGWIYQGPWFFVDGYTVSFPLAAGDSLEVLPMDLDYIARAGTYRFVYQVSLDPLMRRMLPKEVRVSPPFQVTW